MFNFKNILFENFRPNLKILMNISPKKKNTRIFGF